MRVSLVMEKNGDDSFYLHGKRNLRKLDKIIYTGYGFSY